MTRSRSIGVLGAAAIGIGGMVGGGIFAVLGVAAKDAGAATPAAFLIGGALAGLTAYSYSKLSVSMPSAGGTVAFVDRVFGVNDLTGSLNAILWTGYVATTALYASAFGHYTATLLPGGTNPSPVILRLLILVGVTFPWFVNLFNAAVVARTEGLVVAVKLAILVVVIVAGVSMVSPSRLTPAAWPAPLGVVAASMLIFVAYEGFELIANASEDVMRPERTLPLAFGVSVGLVVVLYVAIAAVVVGSLTPAKITASADFALAEAASASLGTLGFKMVAVSAMLATLSAINATLYGSARLSCTLAMEGELPERFEHLRWNSPVGLHVTAGVGAALAISLPLTSISALASAIFLAVFAVVNGAAYRQATSSVWRRVLPALGVLGCVSAFLVLITRSVSSDPASVVVLVALAAGALWAERRLLRSRRRPLIGS